VNLERLVLYVDDTPGMTRTTAWALRLARLTSGRLFAVAVIDPSSPHVRHDSPSSAAEERAWELLYGIEDDAFQQNVRISLLLEQGEPLERLVSISQSYEADVILASADCRLLISELLRQSPRPVVFVK
jgi:nucleotide-binding universal stress UspA family protein